VPAGEQVALEPALASEMLAEHLHDRPSGARWSSVGSVSAIHTRSVTSRDAPQPVRGRLVGPEDAEVALGRLSRITSRRKSPITFRLRFGRRAGGFGTRRRRPRKSGSVSSLRSSAAAVGVRLAPIRRAPFGREAATPASGAVLVEEVLGIGSSHPVFEEPRGRAFVRHSSRRHLVRAPVVFDLLAVDSFGQVQPFGLRSTIIGQRGRGLAGSSAPRPGWPRCGRRHVSRVPPSRCMTCGLVALDEERGVAVAA
jgi:hypothetical protein